MNTVKILNKNVNIDRLGIAMYYLYYCQNNLSLQYLLKVRKCWKWEKAILSQIKMCLKYALESTFEWSNCFYLGKSTYWMSFWLCKTVCLCSISKLYFSSVACWSTINKSSSRRAMINPRLNWKQKTKINHYITIKKTFSIRPTKLFVSVMIKNLFFKMG